MHAAMLLWTIAAWASAQSPASDIDRKQSCAAVFTPEVIAADKRLGEHLEGPRAAALPHLINYFLCRALAEDNVRVCSHLQFRTYGEKQERPDQGCMNEYYATSAILEVISKKGDGARSCLQIRPYGDSVDMDSLCKRLTAGYARATSKSMCDGIPADTFSSRQECDRGMAHYDANPKRCEARLPGHVHLETCRMQAALLKILRTNDGAPCRGIKMCGATLDRRSESCAAYAKAATQTFCKIYGLPPQLPKPKPTEE